MTTQTHTQTQHAAGLVSCTHTHTHTCGFGSSLAFGSGFSPEGPAFAVAFAAIFLLSASVLPLLPCVAGGLAAVWEALCGDSSLSIGVAITVGTVPEKGKNTHRECLGIYTCMSELVGSRRCLGEISDIKKNVV